MIANAVKMKRPMRSAQAIRTAVVSSYRSEGSLYKVLQRNTAQKVVGPLQTISPGRNCSRSNISRNKKLSRHSWSTRC